MRKKRVVVGMSGGADSTVAAILLKEKGYEVTGVTLRFWEESAEESTGQADNIKSIARKAGIPHYTIDCSKAFKQVVIDYFVNEYLSGRTPSPCIKCNKLIKWQWLIEKADELNCDYVATGHYVNILTHNGLYYIGKGEDTVKDQSYYLWELTQDVLGRAITPLGAYTKLRVKEMAENMGVSYLIKKKESMGVCFLRGKDYRQFLRETAPCIIEKGKVKDIEGNVIGTHDGFPFYTIGQKRNIDIPDKSLAVCNVISEENTLVMGSDQSLCTKEFFVNNYYFANPIEMSLAGISLKIRGLGLNPQGYCTIRKINSETLHVALENFAWAVAPGQPVVFYINNRVIGGGYADRQDVLHC